MIRNQIIQGFSTYSREEKIRLASEFASNPDEFIREVNNHWHPGQKSQKVYHEISENVISNFYLPYSLAPNFKINGNDYIIPMVTEESSVVAAACSAAKFWWKKGGFRTHIPGMLKPGHIHFIWKDDPLLLRQFFNEISEGLYHAVRDIEKSMKIRGGGIERFILKDLTFKLKNYFQIEVLFNTRDAMGANFINTCLEAMAGFLLQQAAFRNYSDRIEIIMAILSNYTPQCLVECEISCSIKELDELNKGISGEEFAERFEKAILMANVDVFRAVTNNKGIFNGIDAVLIATGNDFRATEAAGHAWASRNGEYQGLSTAERKGNELLIRLKLPLSLGVVGGLTAFHPLAKASLQLLGNPNAETLMTIAAAAGMANHFSAVTALVTGGIQRGHMKMHLVNILNQLEADDEEKENATAYFMNRIVTRNEVKDFLKRQRDKKKAL